MPDVPQEPDFEVGYKKPPKAYRWQKGMSGNPRGRVKGSKNVGTILLNRLNDRVKTKVNGRLKTETALEAIIRGQVYDALTERDHKKVVYLLGQVERHGLFPDAQPNPAQPEELDETDAEIVRRLLDRLMPHEGGE